MKIILWLALFAALALPAQAQAPKVLVSIAPLAGIAAAVMDGVGMPELLVQGNASPHTYQLKPSDAQKLADAQLILWVGPSFESFMKKSVPEGKSWALTEGDPDLQPMGKEIRLLHATQEDDHAHHAHHDHDHGFYDPHLWLNPSNAVAIARQLADRLAQFDPVNAERYQNNALAFANKLAHWDADMNTLLSPHKKKPFIVFHDAYQYFTKHYGLTSAGVIHAAPDAPPSAKHLAALKARMREQGVVCVLAEPQFKASLVDTLIEGTTARKGLVNPDASDLPLGPELYFTYLKRLVSDFADCLSETPAQQ
jgi:zinc transport system substrate-binding protein